MLFLFSFIYQKDEFITNALKKSFSENIQASNTNFFLNFQIIQNSYSKEKRSTAASPLLFLLRLVE